MPTSAKTTVMPEKSTARLAVAPAMLDRVEFGQPAPPLLAVALDDEERVVDPDREPDHRDHAGHEERQLARSG